MPWTEVSVMSQRLELVSLAQGRGLSKEIAMTVGAARPRPVSTGVLQVFAPYILRQAQDERVYRYIRSW